MPCGVPPPRRMDPPEPCVFSLHAHTTSALKTRALVLGCPYCDHGMTEKLFSDRSAPAGLASRQFRMRSFRNATVIIIIVVGWFALQWELVFIKAPMVFRSARHLLPEWYVRGGGSSSAPLKGSITCKSLRSGYIDDPQAYRVNPMGGSHAQVAEACEDLHMSTKLGIVLMSCDPGRVVWNTFMNSLQQPATHGALWMSEYKSTDPQPVLLHIHGYPEAEDFHPLGMGLYEVSEHQARLFLVNQRTHASTIELIDLERRADSDESTANRNHRASWHARYVRTLYHPIATHTPNAIHAVSLNELYVTNSHVVALRSPPRPAYEAVLASLFGDAIAPLVYKVVTYKPLTAMWQKLDSFIGWGYVAHVHMAGLSQDTDHDGDDNVNNKTDASMQAVGASMPDLFHSMRGVSAFIWAGRVPFANGIVATEKNVIVAATSAPGLYVYDQTNDTYARRQQQRPRAFVPTPFFPDNLAVSRGPQPDTLRIVVAGHPSLKDLEHIVSHPHTQRYAPSWVVEVFYDESISYTGDDADVPYPAQKALMTVPKGWHVRTLLQTNGRSTALLLSSSSSAVWDPTYAAHGSFYVSGLYEPAPIVCRGMYA